MVSRMTTAHIQHIKRGMCCCFHHYHYNDKCSEHSNVIDLFIFPSRLSYLLYKAYTGLSISFIMGMTQVNKLKSKTNSTQFTLFFVLDIIVPRIIDLTGSILYH